jgi:hypothetical protein
LASTSVANSVNATGLSGVLEATAAASTINNIIGGSANDAITITTASAVTVNGGAGTDTITFVDDSTKAVFSGFEVGNIIDGTTKFKGSQLNGSTLAVVGISADLVDVGTIAGSFDSATVNLSGLLFNSQVASVTITADGAGDLGSAIAAGATVNITGSSIRDIIDISHMSSANTVSTGTGIDSIITGAGADTITGGEDADSIVGGAGIDTIVLTETTSAIDTVSLTGVTAAANRDVITGFTTTVDKLQLDLDYTTVATATTVAAVTQTSAITQLTGAVDFNLAGLAATSGTDLYILTGGNETSADLSASTTGTELMKYLGTAGIAATGLTVTATTNKFFIAAYDAGNTYVYQVTEGLTGTGDTQALPADIVLVATLTGTAAVAAGDFVMIA